MFNRTDPRNLIGNYVECIIQSRAVVSVLNTVQISAVNATSDLGFSWIAREPAQRLETARAEAKVIPGDCSALLPQGLSLVPILEKGTD